MFRPTKHYALISEYALISDMRLITRKYGIMASTPPKAKCASSIITGINYRICSNIGATLI